PSRRGTPQIEVSFDIDANGILDVKAVDKATGKSQSVRIEASTSLDKDEIERLKKEAAEHASEDKEKRELAEIRNQSEALVYTAEKSLKDAGDKVPDETCKEIEDKVKDLKDSLEKGDRENIKNKSESLTGSLQKIGEILYKETKDESPQEEPDKEQPGANGNDK
ncbi:MAG: Hsp70 family protein, partial [Patescibacteria group bacterium]